MFRRIELKDGVEEHIVCTSHCVGHAVRSEDDLRNVFRGVNPEDVRSLTLINYESATCNLRSSDMDVLREFVGLEHLSLSWGFDDDVEFSVLKELKNLKSLKLWGYGVRNEEVKWSEEAKWMGEMKCLKSLCLGRCIVRDFGWLRELRGLTSFALKNGHMNEDRVEYGCLVELKNLRKLEISGRFGNDVVDMLCAMEWLDVLRIYSLYFTEINLEKMGNLKELDLSDCQVSRVDGFERLENLRILNLNSCWKIPSENLCKLHSLCALEKLNVSRSEVNDNVLRCVGTLRKLRDLNIGSCGGVTDVGLGFLRDLELERLNLSRCKSTVTDVGLRCLNNEKMKMLNVYCCEGVKKDALMAFRGVRR